MRILRTSLACVGVAILLASTSAGAAAAAEGAAAGSGDTSTSLAEALRHTASERHISASELKDQMVWENAFASLATEIGAKYPDAYAGAGIYDGAPTIRFAASAPAGAMEALSTMSPAVQVIEHVGWTEDEISRVGEDIHYAAQKAAQGEVATDTDVVAGTITVFVAGGTEDKVSAAIESLETSSRSVSDPFVISIETDPTLELGDDALYGGGSLSTCTAGFSVSKSGYPNGIITADHCPNSQSFGSTALSYRGGSSTRDVQWHSSSTYAAPEIHWGYNGVYQVSGKANPVVGQTLCREGKTSGFDCDTTYKANQCRGSYCGMMTMSNREAAGGDSGGPWFAGSTAYGVHSGYVTIWGLPRDMFTPINSGLSTLGLTLKQ